MRRALLIAAREYKQVTSTRGFWILLLALPFAFGVGQIAARWVKPETTAAYVLADASGRYGRVFEQRLEIDHQRAVLNDLATYVRRWAPGPGTGAVWDSGPRGFDDHEVEGFIASGGVDHALARIAPRLAPGAPRFHTDPPEYLSATDKLAPVDQGPAAFEAAVTPRIGEKVMTSAGPRRLSEAIYIPKAFGPSGPPVRVWVRADPDADLVKVLRTELSGALRLDALSASGVAPAAFARIAAVNAPLDITVPRKDHTPSQLLARSVLPLALAYLLLISVITTGGMMLQGLIEERSNKLLESVLACVTPRELMYGKLLGLGGVGLTTITAWVACAVAAVFLTPGDVGGFLRSSLQSAAHPWMAFALIFYFLSGYAVVSAIYLAIGSLSESMQDAQAYLTPVILVIMMPIVFMMTAVVNDPGSVLPHILSWIPLYTPFAMLVRLGGGVSWTEAVGTGAVLVAFMVLEILAVGRIFQVSLLRTGQPPKLGSLLGLVVRKQVD
jgi:ABC-2 type transport system permease protein